MTVEKVLPHPWLKPATAFALGDVHEIVHEQFAVAPRLAANHNRVPESDATRVLGNDLNASSGLRQFGVLRPRDPIDNQHSDAFTIPNTGQPRISQVLRTQWSAVGEDEFLLRFRPLISERQ